MVDSKNPMLDIYETSLDRWGEAVTFGCSVMRVFCGMRGHLDAFTDPDWMRAPAGANLSGNDEADVAAVDERARHMLDRYLRDGTDFGPMPGFETDDAPTPKRLRA